MRRLLPYLLVIFTSSLFAQTYYPFPDSAGVWRIKTSHDDGLNTSVLWYSDYFINGDTVINATTYSKLYRERNGPTSIDTVNATYFGGLREANKKVYFIPDTTVQTGMLGDFCYIWSTPNWPSHNQEMLLYDFGVNVGDTVRFPHLEDSLYIVIYSIDSVLIQSQYRKRFTYVTYGAMSCGGFSVNKYIEGVGHINGLFSHWTYYFENWDELKCFQDEDIFYPSALSCNTVGVDELLNSQGIKIYPNPTTGILMIDLDYDKHVQVEVYDSMGKIIINQSARGFTQFDLSSQAKGIYLVKIRIKGSYTVQFISIQ